MRLDMGGVCPEWYAGCSGGRAGRHSEIALKTGEGRCNTARLCTTELRSLQYQRDRKYSWPTGRLGTIAGRRSQCRAFDFVG